MSRNHETNVLVLQGGGALGAYQAGAYEELSLAGYEPEWLAGISIGAINAAIIAGNEPKARVKRLRALWETLSQQLVGRPLLPGEMARRFFNEASAAVVMSVGVPGFFRPRTIPPTLLPKGHAGATSYYDTTPLEKTLNELVDFDYLAERGPRLSVGAVDVETGNFGYFDNSRTRIGPEHIMASGALPPGFPAVRVGEKSYWDGGLVSNTPLQYVLDTARGGALCIFQVDLFSARGAVPGCIQEVAQREKDIRFSSRTRLTTDRYQELSDLRAAALRLRDRLPESLKSDPDLQRLCQVGAGCPVTLVHLIHRKEGFEAESKDYEFSRLSMVEHWSSGRADVSHALSAPGWKNRQRGQAEMQIFDRGERRIRPHNQEESVK
ncbi:DUF3734 domain-containing protein [Frigidibacter sp. ROC022]|uniref:DUF3734 domain-containing protein n=1 Tax=Frigidibacter sp. ROC022 TaxID=2971796 RepID=UPI00215B04AF|nr:DUF3734 domain-containing protein [Frigidibacter sp. ROC022]MCR8725731.1 DUF3734 domain-containing protein [Frigidibacter sp. ROC022]